MDFYSENGLFILFPVGGNWVVLRYFGGFYPQITRKFSNNFEHLWGFSHNRKVYVS